MLSTLIGILCIPVVMYAIYWLLDKAISAIPRIEEEDEHLKPTGEPSFTLEFERRCSACGGTGLGDGAVDADDDCEHCDGRGYLDVPDIAEGTGGPPARDRSPA